MRLAARCQTKRDFTPISWGHYFDEAHDVRVNESDRDPERSAKSDMFRVYLNNFRQPYAPESRELHESMSEAEFKQYDQYPTLVLLHGGGYSGLTWAPFTAYIENECHCRILAIDLRSHGDTKTQADDKMDIDTLVDDVTQVIHVTHRLCGFQRTPKLILVGHSMGGAIAIKCSATCLDHLPTLAGIVVIDVVEGTAKDALPLMMSVIKTRPNKFPSLQNAIEWSFRSGMAKNLDAARVSMPSNLVNITTGHLGIHDIVEHKPSYQLHNIIKHKFHIGIENLITSLGTKNYSTPADLPLPARVAFIKAQSGRYPRLTPDNQINPLSTTTTTSDLLIEEEDGEEGSKTSPGETKKPQCIKGSTTGVQEESSDQEDTEGSMRPPNLDESGYCWRTDLAKTQPYWPGWFEGLSQQMLEAPVQGKFLLLAGIDRLDKTLTIGQMQGKFMMKVLPKCGHAVHEDSPERVASEIAQFLVRNKFTTNKQV